MGNKYNIFREYFFKYLNIILYYITLDTQSTSINIGLKCGFCDKMCSTPYNLHAHEDKCSRLIQCPTCPKRLDDKHISNHAQWCTVFSKHIKRRKKLSAMKD